MSTSENNPIRPRDLPPSFPEIAEQRGRAVGLELECRAVGRHRPDVWGKRRNAYPALPWASRSKFGPPSSRHG